MKNTKYMLAALAATLVLSLSIVPASAYFTDWTEANGGLPIKVEPTTEVEETFGARKKNVAITNLGTAPVFIRARAYASEQLDVSGEDWTQVGDWYVYGGDAPIAVAPDGKTKELTVEITFPEGAKKDDEYNVIVVYESTPVQYDAEGNPFADWSYTLNTGTAEGGN